MYIYITQKETHTLYANKTYTHIKYTHSYIKNIYSHNLNTHTKYSHTYTQFTYTTNKAHKAHTQIYIYIYKAHTHTNIQNTHIVSTHKVQKYTQIHKINNNIQITHMHTHKLLVHTHSHKDLEIINTLNTCTIYTHRLYTAHTHKVKSVTYCVQIHT